MPEIVNPFLPSRHNFYFRCFKEYRKKGRSADLLCDEDNVGLSYSAHRMKAKQKIFSHVESLRVAGLTGIQLRAYI